MNATRIVFFDGFCVLCNGFVDFVLKADKQHRLQFASLQGETAQTRLSPSWRSSLHTVVYQDELGTYERSTAVIRILAQLGGLYVLVRALYVAPKPVRDAVYNFIARHRVKWFGRRESCRVPTREEQPWILL